MPPAAVALVAAWVAVPVLGGGAIGDALARTDPGAAPAWSAALWACWAGSLVALTVPRSTTLTAARLLVPGGAAVALWSAAVGPAEVGDVAAASCGAAALVLVHVAAVGDLWVDGSSYGDERRFLLRAPSALLLGPLELVVALTVAGVAAGPALLLAGSLAPGAAATALGWPVATIGVRAVHRLHRRWVVLVPAGLVVHDHLALAEPVLVPRSRIVGLGPAPVDHAATDLTSGAAGLALRIELDEPMSVVPAAGRGAPTAAVEVGALLVAPARPGALLEAAAQRRISVRRG